MTRQLTFAAIFLLSSAITSVVSAGIIVDFTSPGAGGSANNGSLTFSTTDPSGTGVSFDITASAVIPAGGGLNGGDVARNNGGIGSTVENTGAFLNVIPASGTVGPANPGVSEVLKFTISNVTGLAAGESLRIDNLLSQNLSSQNGNQTGGFGGTFGEQAADSVTLTSDSGSSFVVNQSDTGDLGAILLAGNNGNNTNTGNTFEHGAGALGFTNSFDLALTDLTANEAVVIQGFEFGVVPANVPEPSAIALLSIAGIGLLVRRRK